MAQRQLVDALEQHRQPVGGGDRGGERVDAGLERLVAQQPRAEALERRDRELLVGARRARPRSRSRSASAAAASGEHEDRLGRARPRSTSQAKRSTSARRLAGARAADDEQRAAGVRDGLALGGGVEHAHA